MVVDLFEYTRTRVSVFSETVRKGLNKGMAHIEGDFEQQP